MPAYPQGGSFEDTQSARIASSGIYWVMVSAQGTWCATITLPSLLTPGPAPAATDPVPIPVTSAQPTTTARPPSDTGLPVNGTSVQKYERLGSIPLLLGGALSAASASYTRLLPRTCWEAAAREGARPADDNTVRVRADARAILGLSTYYLRPRLVLSARRTATVSSASL